MCVLCTSPFSGGKPLNYPINDDETIEDLQLGGLFLIQKKNAFRFGMDSVLLAHFAEVRENDTVADLGTGNGALIFLLHGRNKGKHYYALDIQSEATELVQKNAVLNHMEDRITTINADALAASSYIPSCSVDAAVCNPPYGLPSSSLSSPSAKKATARTQEKETLDHLLKGAFSILKGKGKLSLVYPAAQMLQLMNKLQKYHLEPKRFQLVYPYADKPANLVLIEAVKDARPTLHPMKPLIIYEQDGSLTNDLKSVYHIREQTEF